MRIHTYKSIIRGALSLCATMITLTTMAKHIAYIGTYSSPEGGIHILSIDDNTGEMRQLRVATGIGDPTYLCLNKAKTMLYVGCGIVKTADMKGFKGGVAAFRIEGDDLVFSSFQSCNSAKPCYVSLDNNEKFLFAANYGEGTGCVFKIDDKGDILPEIKHVVHQGRGPHKTRQEKAHVHWCETTPDNQTLYFVDLGIDTVKAYDFKDGNGTLDAMPGWDLRTEPGAGPRHVIFGKAGEFAYVLNELVSTVSVFQKSNGGYAHIQTIAMLPEGYANKDKNTAAALRLTKDGTRLLASNRGHDSIAVYDVDQATGKLTLLAINPTLGRGPRDFELTPNEKFVVVAHQYTDNMVVFAFDRQTGEMKPVGKQLIVPKGVCVKFGKKLD
ncbi:MAG: lactonase family protein [Lentisphaerae bacterium]|jgi:6-phosphogluconolactonase|nr:lactonase family protein [Lentisphaerota bacterium]